MPTLTLLEIPYIEIPRIKDQLVIRSWRVGADGVGWNVRDNSCNGLIQRYNGRQLDAPSPKMFLTDLSRWTNHRTWLPDSVDFSYRSYRTDLNIVTSPWCVSTLRVADPVIDAIATLGGLLYPVARETAPMCSVRMAVVMPDRDSLLVVRGAMACTRF